MCRGFSNPGGPPAKATKMRASRLRSLCFLILLLASRWAWPLDPDRHISQYKIDKNTLKLCQSYHWPGNIRELQNIVERSVILCTGDTFWIDEAWLSSQNASRLESTGPLTQNLQNYERELIGAALAESRGKAAGPNGAAAKLGIPPSTLNLKIKQLNMKKNILPQGRSFSSQNSDSF